MWRLDHGLGHGSPDSEQFDAQHRDHTEERQRLRYFRLRYVEDSHHAVGYQWQRALRPEDREKRIDERERKRDPFSSHQQPHSRQRQHRHRHHRIRRRRPCRLRRGYYGEVSGNTVYNISGITNPGEGLEYDADGLYCDGCAYVTFERNVIFQVDYGIETTSENQVCQANGTEWSGPNGTGTAAKGKFPCYGRYATVRNNIFYNANACGNSIGGYAPATARAAGAMEEAAATTMSSSTTLCTTTAPNRAMRTKALQAANSRFSIRWAARKGTTTKTTLSTPAHPNIWINSYVPSARRSTLPRRRRSIGTCTTRLRVTWKERQSCGLT